MPISQKNTLPKLRLFLYSFLLLFLELALIRFIPANIRLIGYFSNIILLATFLGMGCGMLLSRRTLPMRGIFPLFFLVLSLVVVLFKLEISLASPDAIFFTAITDTLAGLEPNFVLPLVFFLVTIINIPIAYGMGKLFAVLPPLTAYSYDIAGSIAGIMLFTLLSFTGSSPVIWFIIVTVLYALTEWKKSLWFGVGIAMCIASIGVVSSTEKGAIWSPYYKITVTKINDGIPDDPNYAIAVNNIPHQYVSKFKNREPFYYLPYQVFRNRQFKKILIIGAGTGADAATALAYNPDAERIDAVEIDPTIARLGRTLNPDKPYDNPKVHLYIDDGRSFLQNSKEKYDLIIFALTDSLALTAKSSNIRLESFIFTGESFTLVKDHLTTEGIFALYNYYRENWLIDKIAGMAMNEFGYPPVVLRYGDESRAAVILTGPDIQTLTSGYPRLAPKAAPAPAGDDWPFLYMKSRSIPPMYRTFIILLAALSAGTVLIANGGIRFKGFDARFFFFGAGFMLLETKSLATFALLFGSTWLVNSLVFAVLLLFVLLANLINSRFNLRHIWPFYTALFIMLILQLSAPASLFIPLPFPVRLLVAGTFYLCPIFFANIIFSQLFKHSTTPQSAFGINLLGALAGGFLEYLSLAVGYQALGWLVILFYAVALTYRKFGIKIVS
jgi:hypothetical protein